MCVLHSLCELFSLFNKIPTSIQTLFWHAWATLSYWDVIVVYYPLENVKITSLCLTPKREKVLRGFRDETNSEITNQIRCASCQEVTFAPSCRLQAIWLWIAWSSRRKHGKTWNSRIDFYLYRKCILSIHFTVFLLAFPFAPHGSEVFWKQSVQPCSDIKVTGGVLSCHGAVSLTVIQLTDS